MEHYIDLGSRKTKSGRTEKYGSYVCSNCSSVIEARLSFIKKKVTMLCKSCSSKNQSKKNITHGLISTPEYVSWSAARNRCSNPNHHAYAKYGGRGIKFDPVWDDFKVFLKDMGTRPVDTTLDRKNNDGDYTPGNCRWATGTEQVMNQRKKVGCSSSFVGVYEMFNTSDKKFRAYLKVDGKEVNLGMYRTALVAAKVREDYIIKNSLPNKLNKV